tara:strand:+ start:38667 stop:39548 length:882 start_codon:yes stop_codon:yes gene_type:complete
MLCGMGLAVFIAYFWKRKQDLNYRQSPLTQELMRPPGYSLQQKISELNDEVLISFIFMLLAPLLLYSIHLSYSYFGGEPESFLRTLTIVVMGLGILTFFGYRLIWVLDEKKKYKLGLQGEMFTGEELNQLMLCGCRVFHDIQFQYGNIDHVVVSPSGVYSINTKMRGKPKRGEDRAEMIVDHQKNLLRFPDYEHPIPTKQLETESHWLSNYLTSSVGNQVKVQPILAFPGWYIKERIGRGSVYVINPKNPKSFFVNNQAILKPAEMQQIAHQLEQLCRNVEPSYREKKGWGNA